VVCNIAAGILASKISPVWFFVVGSATTATANVLYAAMDEHAPYWTYQFFAQMLCVIEPDVTVVMGYIYITHVADSAEVAVAGASLQFFIALGFVCGPSLSTIIYTDLVKHKHGSALTEVQSKENPDLLSSLRASFWFWAALGFSGKLMSEVSCHSVANTIFAPQPLCCPSFSFATWQKSARAKMLQQTRMSAPRIALRLLNWMQTAPCRPRRMTRKW
jgi:MFS family permease